jgi:hypothetical protein
MSGKLKATLIILGTYLSLWTVLYTVVMGTDFSYYFTYQYLGWAGGGEIPTFITMYAVLGTIIGLGLARLISWASRRNK